MVEISRDSESVTGFQTKHVGSKRLQPLLCSSFFYCQTLGNLKCAAEITDMCLIHWTRK